MKKLIPLFCALLFLSGSCTQIDTTEIWDNINSLEERVSELERLCKEMNSNISALQAIVSALEKHDYVQSVTPIEKDGENIGYVLTFVYSGSVTIFHGNDGQDGAPGANGTDGENGKDGADGQTPIISVAKDADGIYYWTVNGSWLLDEKGQKVKAVGIDGNDGSAGMPGTDGKDGKTPELKIEDGKWFVSYDNGASWLELGQATGDQGSQGPTGPQGPAGEDGDAFFLSVDSSNPEYVLIILANGTELKIPTWKAFESLKVLCDQMNENIESLQTIVSALQNKDYLSSITPIYDGATEIGYILTFTKSGRVTIYHGKDGQTPIIGVAADADGIYYWTVNGSWLLDEKGLKVKAVGIDGQDGATGTDGSEGATGADGKDGKTPELKIEDGKWFVSYDNGASWLELGQATGDQGPQGPAGPQGSAGLDGDSFFQSVTETKDYVLMILANGTEIKISKCTASGATLALAKVTGFTATFNGVIHNKTLDLKVTVYYSTMPTLTVYKHDGKVSVTEFNGETFSLKLTGLEANTTYYYFTEVISNGAVEYGEIGTFATGDDTSSEIDLSSDETSNSYIVSQKGAYKFKAVKGNSVESVGDVSSVEVLWESFGTNETPNVGDLVRDVYYSNGEVFFQTVDTYKEGNAVIAAMDASGKILWSWHVWLTDQPEEQVYFNDAGTMMDRNLGAISATPGDIGALGLWYQWGRKDPFWPYEVKATDRWTEVEITNPSAVTVEYQTSHPTTYYQRRSATSWTIDKTMYDPCPAGWRVPDAVWQIALGSRENFCDESLVDEKNQGINFAGKLGSDSAIWYPFSSRSGWDAWYLTCHAVPEGEGMEAFYLRVDSDGYVYPLTYETTYMLGPVRCQKE